MVLPEDILPFVVVLRTMKGLTGHKDHKHYTKVYERIEAVVLKNLENSACNIVLNSYDLYWIRKACNFILPLAREKAGYDKLKALEDATQRLNAISNNLDNEIKEGHQRT
jgi:hypothetical protein